jgi:hypothetical protein
MIVALATTYKLYHQNTIGLNIRNKTRNQNTKYLPAFYSKGPTYATKGIKFELDNCDD